MNLAATRRGVLVSGVAALLPTASGAQAAPAADRVLDRIARQGLPIGWITTYDARTDPNDMLGRPGGYLSKADFTDERYPDLEPAGTLEVFATVALARRREAYIRRVDEVMPILIQYMYRHQRALLRIETELLPDEAEAYARALRALSV